MDQQSIAGAIFGAAYGDSLARPTEFMNVEAIEAEYGTSGPFRVGKVTDDTQMMLSTGWALRDAWDNFTPASVANHLRVEYIAWSMEDLRGRAAGNTCLGSAARLRKPGPWQKATDPESKGCGANMRVQPAALLPLNMHRSAGLAQLVSAMTHAHPTALAATDLTSYAIRLFATGHAPDSGTYLVQHLLRYAQGQRETYRRDWLGALVGRRRQAAWIASGWDECIDALRRIEYAAGEVLPWELDPCLIGGDGWTAEAALATALLCVTAYGQRGPVAAIRRAAVTRGDSDSIACIAGAMAGARDGLQAWPSIWRQKIEYSTELLALSKWLASTWKAA